MLPMRVLWPVGLAAVLVALLLALGRGMGAFDGQPTVSAALLVSIGTVSAACVAALVWEYKARLDREAKEIEERRQRDERVRDTVLAVQADIESDMILLKSFNAGRDEKMQAFDRRVAAKDPYPLPRGVQSTKGLVLAAIEKDITVLPRQLIKPIVTYYERDIDMGLVLEAFTDGRFDKLEPGRQREQAQGYYEAGPLAQSAAEEALSAINDWLNRENNSLVRREE